MEQHAGAPDATHHQIGTGGNRSLPLEVAFDASKNRVHTSSAGKHIGGNSTGAVDLRNGNEVGSWVIYDALRTRLEVFLSHASLRPPTPALVVPNTTALAARFAEFMFVGFQVSCSSDNGSTDGGFVIHSWSFQTNGLRAVGLASRPPHSASDSVRRAPASGDVAVASRGGSGTVYKAVCPRSGVTYAVKRSKQSTESHNEFTAELTIIADLKHPNLVQLRGWCAEKDELLLVYEFMSNGSLDMALHSCSGI
uniref:Uncharacterized protein n=1 Tax=Aegilops tauschii TaxID=37682 RepID=M8C354_AEGTA